MMKSRGRWKDATARKGFTLIELLVVVAIIALLMGILLPSLSKARSNARAVVCGTHLRELVKGMLVYAHDNDNNITFQDQTTNAWWMGKLEGAPPSLTFTRSSGLLAPYLDLKGVTDCPEAVAMGMGAQEEVANFSSPLDVASKTASYGANFHTRGSFKLSALTSPLETMIFADSAQLATGSTQPTKFYQLYAPFFGANFHGRHSGKGNVAWYDGHVTSEPAVLLIAAPMSIVAQFESTKVGYLSRKQDVAATPLNKTSLVNWYFFTDKDSLSWKVNSMSTF